MREFSALFSLIFLFNWGCGTQSTYIDKRGILDESLTYFELDTSDTRKLLGRGLESPTGSESSPPKLPEGEAQIKAAIDEATKKSAAEGISFEDALIGAVSPQNGQARGVPHPALVDMDSKILINVSKAHLTSRVQKAQLTVTSPQLLDQKQEIRDALVELSKVIDLKQKAIEAYMNPDLEVFEKAKKESQKVKKSFRKKLTKLWPKGTPEYSRLSAENGLYDFPKFTKLQGFLQEKIEVIEAGDQAIVEEVRDRKISLRLEAFLKRPEPNKDPIPIHLDGYDSIQQGIFERRDRVGLNLSKEERAELQRQVEATNQAVAIAEQVRKKEITLKETLHMTLPMVSPRLGRLMVEVDNLIPKFEKKTLRKRFDATEKLLHSFFKQFLEEFKKKLKERGQKLSDRTESDIGVMPKELRFFLEGLSLEAPSIIAEVQDLRQGLLNIRSGNQTALFMQTVKLLGDLEDFSRRIPTFTPKVPDITSDMKEDLQKFIETKLEYLKSEAKEEISLGILETMEPAQDVSEDLKSYYEDLRSVAEVIKEVVNVLKVVDQDVTEGIRAPESLNVPLEKVKNTFIDLKYTPRLEGDTIRVRATLSQGDGEEEIDKTSAEFLVNRFGLYGKLSPAVVLVKPTELKGGSDDFQFSPILSWMAHYAPRPEETGNWIPVQRALRPAIGIHSALLHFDGTDSDSVQIGLGGTISFWENRLQFGGGINLMADGKDDGLIYYFVGTDLIGILQTIQSTAQTIQTTSVGGS